jgi:hypothetical protein
MINLVVIILICICLILVGAIESKPIGYVVLGLSVLALLLAVLQQAGIVK